MSISIKLRSWGLWYAFIACFLLFCYCLYGVGIILVWWPEPEHQPLEPTDILYLLTGVGIFGIGTFVMVVEIFHDFIAFLKRNNIGS